MESGPKMRLQRNKNAFLLGEPRENREFVCFCRIGVSSVFLAACLEIIFSLPAAAPVEQDERERERERERGKKDRWDIESERDRDREREREELSLIN